MNNTNQNRISIPRLITKTILVLLIINFGWILLPKGAFSHISFYNRIFDGRKRLPFGENPEISYNLSTFDLNAMFATHEINKREKSSEKIRIVLVGDSSIWGFLQTPNENLSGLLNEEFASSDIEIFNLGYPSISVLKDLQIIDKAVDYDPDLIIWFTTLESLPRSRQTEIPFNKENPENINDLVVKYELGSRYLQDSKMIDNTFWNRRRNISDIFRLQLYGFLWDATGIDQIYPESFEPALRDFPDYDGLFHEISEKDDLRVELELGIFKKVVEKNHNIDFIIINEPILISMGENSHFQYNYYYPKWAYDEYRDVMNAYLTKNDIKYYDFWNLIPEEEFTNSAIHLTKDGEKIFSNEISAIINNYIGD